MTFAMKLREERAEGHEEGRVEGRIEATRTSIISLLKNNISAQETARLLGQPLSVVHEIEAELHATHS